MSDDNASTTQLAVPVNSPNSESKRLHYASDLRVLVIDDDPAIGRLIQIALDKHDFEVVIMSDVERIEDCLRQRTYRVIILDYVIPGQNANEILKWLKKYQPDASIIVVTAYPSTESAVQCLRAHAHDYITKPFDIDHLRRTVTLCLEKQGLLRLSEEALREELGLAIRERRKMLGLTLAQLAERTNVSLGYLSQLELGKNSASIETLYKISLGLQIRLAELLQPLQPN